jgi:hypothetical protein
MCRLRANGQQCPTKGDRGKQWRNPYITLRGTRHGVEMTSLCDMHWLVGCVNDFSMTKLRTLKVWLCVLMISASAVKIYRVDEFLNW